MVSDPSEETRTHKVYHALDTICLEFDLSHPTWLDSHYREFKQRSRTRFYREHFIEEISFDYLEIQIMEED